MDPIGLESIDIMQDCVVKEPTLLDKDDFDIDWKAVDEPLITSSNVDDNEDFNFYEDDEIIIPPNGSQWE